MKLIVDVEAFEKYLDLYIVSYEIPGAMEALREASENEIKEEGKAEDILELIIDIRDTADRIIKLLKGE